MTIDELKIKINGLSNSHIGSFGEYIVSKCIFLPLEKKHKNNTDFIINGIPIDVKTHRVFKNKSKKYTFKNNNGIDLAIVFFLDDCIELVIKCLVINKIINWKIILGLYEEWQLNRKIIANVVHLDLEEHYKNIHKIKLKLNHNNNDPIRFIYRTNQKQFNNESPDNLIPRILSNKRITIFINYRNCSFAEKEIDGIYAFYDIDSIEFPKLKKKDCIKRK